MFFNQEDDEQDFLSPGGSKLGALFGIDKAGSQGGNESLTYTAPKQPKKKESTPPGGKTGPVVTFAVAIHAYKYVDQKFASQGKLGCAILANHSTSEYFILMYVTQQQTVTKANITSAFAFTVQANNYANFYDDARQSWSILFDNEQHAKDFAKHVGLAKALSSGPTPSGLVTQDMTLGEGDVLQTGDSVEVKYTGWRLTNNTFGDVFDTNVNADKLFRFKLGAGKVIKGWDSGVVGMKKGGKRFLVVPPGLAYGTQGMGDKVSPNSTLLFEVEIVRVKLVGKESSPSPAPNPAPVPAPGGSGEADEGEEEDQTVKGRTRSISDQLSHSPTQDTSKAKLISRMAKMGKPMLPLSGAVAASPDSDHEDSVPASPVIQPSQPAQPAQPARSTVNHQPHGHQTEPRFMPVQSYPQPVMQPSVSQQQYHGAESQPAFLQGFPAAQQLAPYQPQQNYLQQQQQQQMNMMQQMPMPQAGIPGLSQGTDMMLLSETRQQHTDVRLSLSKVSDKVDQVLQKLDHGATHPSGGGLLPNMETSVLLHNITRIVQENERLKQDVFEKSAKIESQNEKISELLQRNQSFVEKSQVLMEQRNEGLFSSANQSQNRVLSLEQDKVVLTKQLSEASSQISSLQVEVTGLKKREFELSQQVENTSKSSRTQGQEVETLRTQHTEDESRIAELQRQLRDERTAKKAVEGSMATLQEELSDQQAARQALEKSALERKRKSAEEKRQLEEDMEDLKANLEAEIQSLKEKLRKQKTSANVASQQQISQLEEEIHADWQRKCEQMVEAASEKHTRALRAVIEEKDELQNTVNQLEQKIASLRQSSSGGEQRAAQLQGELEQMAQWKEKYESLRASASSMKERYEARIEELEQRQTILQQQLEQAQSGRHGNVEGPTGVQGLLDEVKKIMNTVFKEMRETFEADESYTGAEILQAILNSIKTTTLTLMNKLNSSGGKGQNESEEEEEEDDDEEDEEEDDDDEDGEDDDKEEKAKAEEITTGGKEADHIIKEELINVTSDITATAQSAIRTEDNIQTADEKNAEEDEDDAEKEKEEEKEDVKNDDAGSYTDELDSAIERSKSYTEMAAQDEPVGEMTSAGMKAAGSLEDLLDSALETKATGQSREPTPIMDTEPPPLSDEEPSDETKGTKERTKSIFDDDDGDDDNVEDILGITNKTADQEAVQKNSEKQSMNEEDMKPKPPPPLFGDDDDDDDLDWLS
ncbi:FK506-binding protein 15-like isoform X2 [Dreissena polymorpha]|uniref:FK506-binding protein 15-like isoform X2 n=1 Tax=Dreissena polymorpha TaxID=45954 RepID=UPI0022645E69|nr:FK506-binding protein 15-like isoform X2 [Dreissena polymorpha]